MSLACDALSRSVRDGLVSTARAGLLAAAALAGLLAGCGDSDDNPPVDAAPDGLPGVCGADALFTGEYVNWDSTEADFCGVLGAKWTVRGDTSRTNTTAPNGRFQLCVANQAQTVVDITPPTAASDCRAITGETYVRRGVAIATREVIAAEGVNSARAMTETREAEMFGQVGAAYDATKAQLVVHVDGTPRAVSIAAAHGTTQRFDGSAWAAGDTGSDVFFPNVAVGATLITVAGGAVGATTVALEASAYTYVTVIAN